MDINKDGTLTKDEFLKTASMYQSFKFKDKEGGSV